MEWPLEATNELYFVQELMLILTEKLNYEVIVQVVSKYFSYFESSSPVIVVKLHLTNKSRVSAEFVLAYTLVKGAQCLPVDCNHAKRYLTYVYSIIKKKKKTLSICKVFETH